QQQLRRVRAPQADAREDVALTALPNSTVGETTALEDANRDLLEVHTEERHLIYRSAVSLDIVWKDSHYWQTVPDPKATFGTAMEVNGVFWFDVRGKLSAALQPGKAYTAAWRISANLKASGSMLQTGYLTFVTTVEAPGAQPEIFRAIVDPLTLLQNAKPPKAGYFELEVATFGLDQKGTVLKDFTSLGSTDPGGEDGAAVEVRVTFEIVNHDGTSKFGLRLDSLVLRHALPAELQILNQRADEYNRVERLIDEAMAAERFSPTAFWEGLVEELMPCFDGIMCDQCRRRPTGDFWYQCRSCTNKGKGFQTDFCETCYSAPESNRWLKAVHHKTTHTVCMGPQLDAGESVHEPNAEGTGGRRRRRLKQPQTGHREGLLRPWARSRTERQ
ncbi:hypothetical protein KFL_009850010, partial [Klebsormidium nitens]